MSRILFSLIALLLPSLSFGQSPIESEGSETFEALRESYRKELIKARKPLNESFLAALKRELDKQTAVGDLESALFTKGKIERFEAFLKRQEQSATAELTPPAPPVTTAKPPKPLPNKPEPAPEMTSTQTATTGNTDSAVLEIKDTTWTWTGRNSRIDFKPDGTAVTKMQQIPGRPPIKPATYSWKRINNDTFKIVRQGLSYPISGSVQLLDDGKTAIYRQLKPTQWDRVLNRLIKKSTTIKTTP